MSGLWEVDTDQSHGAGFWAAAEIVAITQIASGEGDDLLAAAGTLESFDAHVTRVIGAYAEVSSGLG